MSDVKLDPLASDVAIRNLRKGKAHRGVVLNSTVWTPSSMRGKTATACKPGLVAASNDITEAVPLAQTAPEDRCRRCFPTALEAP